MNSSSIAVIGIGQTRFGRHLHSNIRELAQTATSEALAEAGCEARDIDAVYFANAAAGLITGQEMIRGQVALRHSGLMGKPIVNVENACASGSTAFYLACQAIQAGAADVCLVVGAEKLTHEDKRISSGAFAGAIDLLEPLPAHLGKGNGSLFMDVYAEKTRKYMQDSGATGQDFAQIVVKSRQFGTMNPLAHFQDPITVDEVLASRPISDPLTLPMCSPIDDGAAALVLCSSRALNRFAARRKVWVGASVLISGYGGQDADAEEHSAVRVSRMAYEQAGIGPDDLHVVELHDATAPAELIHYENLGLCPRHGAPELLRSGATGLNGRICVNPSGGLLSRGHPIGATGVAQINEIVRQLSGTAGASQREGARVGLAENNGGQIAGDAAAATATVLHL